MFVFLIKKLSLKQSHSLQTIFVLMYLLVAKVYVYSFFFHMILYIKSLLVHQMQKGWQNEIKQLINSMVPHEVFTREISNLFMKRNGSSSKKISGDTRVRKPIDHQQRREWRWCWGGRGEPWWRRRRPRPRPRRCSVPPRQ